MKKKCYVKDCKEKPHLVWTNSKKEELHMCKEHFDLVEKVFSYGEGGTKDGLRHVEVIPE